MTSAIELDRLSRRFGDVRAVDEVSLSVAEGEFFALLGPSGSGKTTCLRLIAGFERPDSGSLRLFGEDVTRTPPYRRDINTVFQDYALFPHLSVIDNVAYGLRMKGMAKAQRHRQAQDALALVKLPEHGARRPSELSGGQRQRVALARALVNRPRVLLLDEPLGALDLKLREQMQDELKTLQRRLGITFILVTHDQGEALSLADRIAVFSQGRVLQCATPQELYRRPGSRFVADFVGSSNMLPPALTERLTGVACWSSLRPEDLRQVEQGGLAGTVTALSYRGGATRVSIDCGELVLACLLPSRAALPEVGAEIRVDWQAGDLHLMEDER